MLACVAVVLWLARTASAAPTERGVCYAHAWAGHGEHGYGSVESAHTVDHLARIGTNAISLMPFGIMRSARDPEIRAIEHPGAETDARLRAEIRAAHARGMRVALKPNIWIIGDTWAGELSWDSDEAFRVWFDSLRRLCDKYARLAAEEGVDLYLFATELKSATARDPRAFRALIHELRAIYPAAGKAGALSYAANWDEAATVPFWDALDVVAVDVYAPLADSETPTDTQLAAGALRMADSLAVIARRTGKPAVIAEIGYRAAAGAASKPSLWPEHDAAAYDPQMQARCFRAALAALWEQPWLRGVYVWKWFTDDKDERGPIDYSPSGKPAEGVLRDYFTRPARPR